MLNRAFTMSFFLILSINILIGQTPITLFTVDKKVNKSDEIPHITLEINKETLKSLYKNKAKKVSLEIPFFDNNYIAELETFELLTDDFKLSSNKQDIIPYTPGVYYRGKLRDDGGIVAFSIFKDEVMAIISPMDGKTLNLGKPANSTKKDNKYVIYDARELGASPHVCHAEELPEYAERVANLSMKESGNRSVGGCVNMYVEGDYDLNVSKGGVTQAADYLTGLWNPIATLYDNEDVEVNVSQIFIWASQDPYSTTDAGTALDQFGDQNPSFDGDLAMLQATAGNGLGGLAWVDVLCANGFTYSYSGIGLFYSNFPSYSWSVEVSTHELGHNLGSPHTHNCDWPGGAIDNCYDTEGSCSPGPAPTNGGTIMSYCHLSNTGINFNNGFGPLPGDLIREKVDDAGCLGSCFTSDIEPTADFDYDVVEVCASVPAEVQFTDQSEDANEYNWTFPGGTPETSTDQNPIVTYDTPGTYDATLEVSNSGNTDEITYTDVIEVIGDPVASFDFDVDGNVVQFTDLSDYADSYEWDFGDNESSSSSDPTHTYLEDGEYDVYLDIANDCGDDFYSQTIIISTPPTAGFTADVTSGCTPLTVSYTNTSSNNTDSFQWTFDGGTPNTSTEANPVVVYNQAGVYNVNLTVSNEAGQDQSLQINYITVNSVPETSFTYEINGSQVTFTNTSTNATSYLWDFGNGESSTEINPTIDYASFGTYQVILTSTNECGNSTLDAIFDIELQPTADFLFDVTEDCIPFEVTYDSGLSTNVETYQWNFVGGTPSSSTEANPVVTYNEAGIFSTELTVTNPYGTDTYTVNTAITAVDIPTVDFDYNTNIGEVSFTSYVENGTILLWDFGNGESSSETNPTINYTEGGIYTVILTVENDCGMTTHQEDIEILFIPDIAFDADITETCLPATITFTNLSENADAIVWSFPGGTPSTSTDQNPTVTYDTPGQYPVTLEGSNNSGTNTLTQDNYITIVPDVDASFTILDNGNEVTVTFTGTGDNIEWDFGDGNTATGTTASHIYTQQNTYTISVTASNLCGSATSQQEINIYDEITANILLETSMYCIGDEINFSFQSSDNYTSVEWIIDGMTFSEENISLTDLDAGEYTVTLTLTNPNHSTTTTANLSIVALPIAAFDLSQEALIINTQNQSTNANTYAWQFGDGNTSTDTSPSHNYIEEGQYTVALTATNQCGVDMTTQDVVISVVPVANFEVDQTTICVNGEVNVTYTGSQNIDNIAWQTDGATILSSVDNTLVLQYNQTGTYDISVVVDNAAGTDQYLLTNAVTVIDEAVGSIEVVENDLTITCTAISEYATEYVWDFGDGNTSTEENPTHTYAQEGEYEVTLRLSNVCGSNAISQSINNYTVPVADFNQSAIDICVGDIVSYAASQSDNVEVFAWTFEGGTPSTSSAKNQEVSYDQAGIYQVMLMVSNPAGSDQLVKEMTIEVKDKPIVSFEIIKDLKQITLSNTTTDATEYLWDFGDGNTSTEANPTHTYADFGEYNVSLKASNECGTSSLVEAILLDDKPTANFTVNTLDVICIGDIVTFVSLASSNVESYAWTFPGGTPSTSTEENPTVAYNAPGNYEATLEVRTGENVDIITKTNIVSVIDVPTAGFDVMQLPEVITITNTATNANQITWYVNGNIDGEGDNYQFNPPTNGTFLIEQICTNNCGEDSATFEVQYSGYANANFSSNVTEVCEKNTVQFNALFEENIGYTWTFEGGEPSTSTELNPTITYPTAGTYTVSLVANNYSGSDESIINQYITVEPNVFGEFTVSNEEDLISGEVLATNATNIVWSINGTEVSTSNTMEFTALKSGDYTVTATYENDCNQEIFTKIISINLLDEINFEDIIIVPNPVSTQVFISNEGTISYNIDYWLHDAAGRFITKGVLNDINRSIYMQDLPQGVYILTMDDGKKSTVKRLVKI